MLTRIIYFCLFLGSTSLPFLLMAQETPYCTQMHIHGQSHHNGVDMPGSMQWHAYFADSTKTDLIWWTDHQDVYDQTVDFKIDLAPAVMGPTLEVTGMNGYSVLPVRLVTKITGGNVSASLQNEILSMTHTGFNANNFTSFFYYPRSSTWKIQGFILPRPVSSKARLEFDLQHEIDGNNEYIECGIALSWHFDKKEKLHNLVFRLGNKDTSYVNLNRDTAFIYKNIQGINGHFSLDLLQASSMLPYGDDNIITDMYFGISNRAGNTTTARFSNIQIKSLEPLPQYQIDQALAFANKYSNDFNHDELVGIEYSPYNQAKPQPHINAFLPTQNIAPYLFMGDEITKNSSEEFIKRIHLNGGVASYNHLFGPQNSDYPLHAPNDRLYKRDSVADALISSKVYQADILEVGYINRGQMTLRDHLYAWDKIMSAGIVIYGNGVSDAHGNRWEQTMIPNPYVTWILSDGKDATSLIAAIKKGRMFFGSNFLFKGKLDFTVNGHRMGSVNPISDSTGTLNTDIDSLPVGYKVYLYQGLINSNNQVSYIHEKTLLNSEIFTGLDLSKQSFIRLEVYKDDTIPVVFSNPVFFYNPDLLSVPSFDGMFNAFPNPVVNQVYFPFQITESQMMQLNIYDARMQLINQIDLGYLQPMKYKDVRSYMYDCRDKYGSQLSPGIYFYQLVGEKFSGMEKFILVGK